MESLNMDKVEDLLEGLTKDMSSLKPKVEELPDKLKEIISDSFMEKIERSSSKMLRLIENGVAVDEVLSALADLISNLGDSLISIFEQIIDVVLEPLQDLSKKFAASIDKPLNIDKLSGFFEIATFGKELNLRNLGTLVISAPMVLLFKSVTGEDTASLKSILSGDLFSALSYGDMPKEKKIRFFRLLFVLINETILSAMRVLATFNNAAKGLMLAEKFASFLIMSSSQILAILEMNAAADKPSKEVKKLQLIAWAIDCVKYPVRRLLNLVDIPKQDSVDGIIKLTTGLLSVSVHAILYAKHKVGNPLTSALGELGLTLEGLAATLSEDDLKKGASIARLPLNAGCAIYNIRDVLDPKPVVDADVPVKKPTMEFVFSL